VKNILIICVFVLISFKLFSQEYSYGLSQDDLNLIQGQYVPNVDISRYRWAEERTYSWGAQKTIINATNSVVIDYYGRQAAFYGSEYENYLILRHWGIIYFIKSIEKVSNNVFILSLLGPEYSSDAKAYEFVDFGQILLTFSGERYVKISDINFIWGFSFNVQWWKSAGPTVVNK